jgi:23S rRNA pseudouridine1911/1915/1917 synthase
MAGGRTITVTIDAADAGQRLDRVLVAALAPQVPDLSRSRIKALIEAGRVTGEATIIDPSRRVKPGQIFAVFLPDPEPTVIEAQALPLAIIFEDAHVIVVDKPPGLVVHPAPGNPDRTLVNALIAHCGQELAGIGGVQRPGIVHRLDKDTSGLIVAAKTERAHRSLTEQFAARTVDRAYAALVWGVPRPRSGEIALAIGRSSKNRKKMATVHRGGRAALTRYKVVQEFAGGAVSLVECRLATGRTHQIRVHMTAIGHPLLGDPVYGRPRGRWQALPAAAAAAVGRFDRQALDAWLLGFTHPESGERMRFTKNYSHDINLLVSILESV